MTPLFRIAPLLLALVLASPVAGQEPSGDEPTPGQALLAESEAAAEDGLDAEEMDRLGARALALIPTAPNAEEPPEPDPREAIRGAGIAIQLSRYRSGPEAERLRSRTVGRLVDWLTARPAEGEAAMDETEAHDVLGLPEEAWTDLFRALDGFRRVDTGDGHRAATDAGTMDEYHRLLRRIQEATGSERLQGLVLWLRLENRLAVDRLYGGLSRGERAEMAAEVRRGWERFPDARITPEATYAEAVRWPLRELERLYLGAIAPEIEGVDLHGEPMKLSDYRGRVVLLDFWASWCPPCIDAIPDQKELLARHPDGLAIVGVSGDVERQDGLASEERHGATWRSFWAYWPGADDLEEPLPPLKDTWYVRFWPTYYVLDREGVIHYKGSWDEDLEAIETVIDRLLAEPAA